MFVRIWQFRVASEKADEFRRVYGPAGAWAELFAREIGFLGTELLQSTSDPDIFVTMDSWDSTEAWAAFLRAWGDDYTALDHRTESLVNGEEEVGAFESGNTRSHNVSHDRDSLSAAPARAPGSHRSAVGPG